MLRKIKKMLPAVVSAVLCVTMALGITASAASVWSETKALTNARYSSTYIKWVEKYSQKETKNTVTFAKSRTKKFLDKQIKAVKSDDPSFGVDIATKDVILSVAYKGKKMKMVVYEDGTGLGMYFNSKNITMLSVEDKTKITLPVTEDLGYDDIMDEMLGKFMNFDSDDYYADLGIAENAKGKIFKFKSNDKIYYYEEFESAEYNKYGYLFDEKGNPLAMIGDDLVACFKISYSLKNSYFTVPDGYKEIDINDFDF